MSVRLNKLLAERGIGARRKCDLLIQEGRVRVNGEVVREPGTRVEPERDRVEVAGRRLPPPAEKRYYALNKPVGVITTLEDPEGRRTVRDFMPGGSRLFPVGRLDADTSGLLILTNDGELAHHLMHPRYGVEKVYRAWVGASPAPGQIARLRGGVEFEPGVISEPARVRVVTVEGGRGLVEIIIHEGRYRQVRRMLEAVGLDVQALHRAAYGPVTLGPLERGMWRELSEGEVARLRAASARARPRHRGAGEYFSARRGLVRSDREGVRRPDERRGPPRVGPGAESARPRRDSATSRRDEAERPRRHARPQPRGEGDRPREARPRIRGEGDRPPAARPRIRGESDRRRGERPPTRDARDRPREPGPRVWGESVRARRGSRPPERGEGDRPRRESRPPGRGEGGRPREMRPRTRGEGDRPWRETRPRTRSGGEGDRPREARPPTRSGGDRPREMRPRTRGAGVATRGPRGVRGPREAGSAFRDDGRRRGGPRSRRAGPPSRTPFPDAGPPARDLERGSARRRRPSASDSARSAPRSGGRRRAPAARGNRPMAARPGAPGRMRETRPRRNRG